MLCPLISMGLWQATWLVNKVFYLLTYLLTFFRHWVWRRAKAQDTIADHGYLFPGGEGGGGGSSGLCVTTFFNKIIYQLSWFFQIQVFNSRTNLTLQLLQKLISFHCDTTIAIPWLTMDSSHGLPMSVNDRTTVWPTCCYPASIYNKVKCLL